MGLPLLGMTIQLHRGHQHLCVWRTIKMIIASLTERCIGGNLVCIIQGKQKWWQAVVCVILWPVICVPGNVWVAQLIIHLVAYSTWVCNKWPSKWELLERLLSPMCYFRSGFLPFNINFHPVLLAWIPTRFPLCLSTWQHEKSRRLLHGLCEFELLGSIPWPQLFIEGWHQRMPRMSAPCYSCS